MRTCKYCGRQTSKAANFCWYCARELDARPERPDVSAPAGRLDRWVFAGAALAVLLAILLGLLLQ